MAVPRLAPWAGMRRRVATGERLRRGYLLFVIWGRAHFHSRSTIFDHLRVLCGFAVNIFGWGEIGMSARDAPATGRPRSCERGYGSIRDLHRID